ncbi:glycoside hydrolase [Chitinophaga caseinilytica]|uniref:Glycoside hydrolase n=1 Tax=Chitinophaga caseinilytica TaxID=2267521 RepID=A0ABZ2YZV6_9BACT
MILKIINILGITVLSAFHSGSGGSPVPGPFPGNDPISKSPQTVTILPGEKRQVIHSFGASDCWTAKFIGTWANASKKEQVADYLFSLDTAQDGSPKGIGLSLWRFNIGAGSFEQGAGSHIGDEWRREECFQSADGSYDWSKSRGQQWFLRAAKQRGVRYTLGFSISPQVHLTNNGKAFNGTTSPGMNIQPGKMAAYAEFLAEVTKHFGFDYLSPVNEPQWNWGKNDQSSQEGTQATNGQITELSKLTAQRLSGTHAQVVIGEAGTLEFLYGKNHDQRGDQICQFFSPSSPNFLGNTPNIAKIISGHSYFTTCPDTNLINVRQKVAERAAQTDAGLQIWQTEFGILGDICGQYNGAPRNTGIDYGLYVAKVLHHDLAVMGVSSWQWWLAVSPYDYSDALVYISDVNGKMDPANCKTDGIVQDSKQLWAFGQYARFVRPGMQRVETAVSGTGGPYADASTLMVSAYTNEATKELTTVFINFEPTEKHIRLNGVKVKGRLNQYITDGARNCKRAWANPADVVLPARSIVTLTGKYQ